MADYAAATNQRVPEVNPKYVDQARLPFAKRSAPPLLRISSAVEARRKPRRTTPVVVQGDYTGAQKLLISAIPNLRAFATSLSRNSSHADDLVQETLVKAWANLASFQMGTNMKAWLFTILYNTFFSELRKRKHEVEDADEEQAGRMCELPRQQTTWRLSTSRRLLPPLAPIIERRCCLWAQRASRTLKRQRSLACP